MPKLTPTERLISLVLREGPLTVGAILDSTGTTPQNIVKILRSMVSAGIIVRDASTEAYSLTTPYIPSTPSA